MLGSVTLTARLRDLDDRVLRNRSNAARQAWGRRHGWSVFLLLGLAMLAFSAWAFATDRPGMAAVPLGCGVGYVGVAAVLFVKRTRS